MVKIHNKTLLCNSTENKSFFNRQHKLTYICKLIFSEFFSYLLSFHLKYNINLIWYFLYFLKHHIVHQYYINIRKIRQKLFIYINYFLWKFVNVSTYFLNKIFLMKQRLWYNIFIKLRKEWNWHFCLYLKLDKSCKAVTTRKEDKNKKWATETNRYIER